jgi:uracil-DNA glycosylase family 4
MTQLTPWQKHVRDWSGCTRCSLSKTRTQVVLARGDLPCDLLFIGEAPGRSEDMIGLPFVGPAGHLLNAMIRATVPESIKYALTNLICCLPLGDDGDKVDEPDPKHIKACAPRLQELVNLASPKVIVCVGTVARKYLDRSVPHRQAWSVEIDHPAFILRQPPAFRGITRQKAEVRLRNAILKMGQEPPPNSIPEAVLGQGLTTPRNVSFESEAGDEIPF